MKARTSKRPLLKESQNLYLISFASCFEVGDQLTHFCEFLKLSSTLLHTYEIPEVPRASDEMLNAFDDLNSTIWTSK